MKSATCIAAVVLLASPAATLSAEAPARTVATPAAAPDVKAVTDVGSGQAGYVHYFLLTHPDGELEYQVGVELEDRRIAWSFPGVGVSVADFVKRGTIEVTGKRFGIEHLYGVRPFANSGDMSKLQKELTPRVAQWVDAETPYCFLRERGQPFCLSCGDFVVRILYPGTHPMIPALPKDFVRMTGAAYTTDDLLLYLAGLHQLPDHAAMLKRLATLDVPAVMREDLLAMIQATDPAPATATQTATTKPVAPTAQAPAAKPAGQGRIATRRQQARRL